MKIEMISGKIVEDILSFWKEIEKGNRINYNKAMSVNDAMVIMKMIRNMPIRIEVQILIDDVMVSVIRDISVELADELKGYLG